MLRQQSRDTTVLVAVESPVPRLKFSTYYERNR
jgi:hypothetical protein